MSVLRKAILGLAALTICLTCSIELQAQFRRPNLATDFTGSERQQLKNLMMGYITAAIVNDHASNAGTIHCENTLFLTWHREYVEKVEAWLMTQDWGSKYVPFPKWRPDFNPIPNEFFNNLVPPTAIFGGFPNLVNQDITGFTNYDLAQYITPSVCANFPAGSMFRACVWAFTPGTALDNFALALENDHNWVHDNVGGVMSDPANSPAAAIFFNWHADVDDYYRYYECQCGLAPAKDLFIKDNPADIGAEPNNSVTNGVFWESPDIWVRQNADVSVGPDEYQEQDRLTRHQNPEYKALGGDNYIYVRIRNIGCQATTATEVDLHVYGSAWSPGVWQWPVDWTEITPVAGIDVPAMQPGEVRVIEVPWTVPDPSLFPNDPHHYCLIARLVSGVDPMHAVEGTDVGYNTWQNNNWAWRNVSVYDSNPFNIVMPGGKDFTKFFVGATRRNQTNAAVRFDFPNNPTLRATVDLGTDLHALWVAGGAQGQGITRLEGTKIAINQPGATIRGLALPFGTVYRPAIQAYMRAPREGGTAHVAYGDIVPVRITQHETNDAGQEVLTGGITYEIRNNPTEELQGNLITNVSVTQTSCPEAADGAITLTMAAGGTYTYWWSNGASTNKLTGLARGKYRVVVRRDDNKIQEKVIEVGSRSTLNVEVNSTNRTCGQNNGSASASVTGGVAPYAYQWYKADGTPIPGATTSRISNVGKGLYLVRVSDRGGCVINSQINVLETMSMLGIGFTKQDASSATASDGWAEAHASGMAPFTYLWNNGATTKRITGLRPGIYTVTVTDAMGCTKTGEVQISSPQGRVQLGIEKEGESIESLMKIVSVVPNPASDRAELNFTLVEPGTVRVEIYDELGKLVKFVEEASRLGGANSVRIDTRTLPSGRYSLRLAIGNRGVSTPLVVVR